jgi:hypothetical protein
VSWRLTDCPEAEPLIETNRRIQPFDMNSEWLACLSGFLEKFIDQHPADPAVPMRRKQRDINSEILLGRPLDHNAPDRPALKENDVVISVREVRCVLLLLTSELHLENRGLLCRL